MHNVGSPADLDCKASRIITQFKQKNFRFAFEPEKSRDLSYIIQSGYFQVNRDNRF